MAVSACSENSVDLPLNGVWDITVAVRDADRCLTDQAPVVTVTLPDDSTATPTVERLAVGTYRTTYTVASSGRYVARAVAAGYGAADFTAYVTEVTIGTAMPDLDAVKSYLGQHSWSDGDIQDALDAEAAAQRRCCLMPADYEPDLANALKRRVQRNLAMRGQPAVQISDNGDPIFTPTNDPEVRRLEGPYRKLTGR